MGNRKAMRIVLSNRLRDVIAFESDRKTELVAELSRSEQHIRILRDELSTLQKEKANLQNQIRLLAD